MTYEEAKELIVKGLKKKLKVKTKFYFKELAKILGVRPRDKEAKKHINRMIRDEILEYWSSGSTSMYGLKGKGKQAKAENED